MTFFVALYNCRIYLVRTSMIGPPNACCMPENKQILYIYIINYSENIILQYYHNSAEKKYNLPNNT